MKEIDTKFPGKKWTPWQPWWLKPLGLMGFIVGIRRREWIETEKLAPSSVDWDVSGKDFDLFLKPDEPTLLNDIRERGQQEPIIAIDHCLAMVLDGVKTNMVSDPELKMLHVLEGHHRWTIAKHLGRPLLTDVYRLLVFPVEWWTGVDPTRLYSHRFDDSFWSLPQTNDTKMPWFWPHHFQSLDLCPKCEPLLKCFERVKSLKMKFTGGVDFGCAEGAYTWHADRELDIPMIGLDAELARVTRGNMLRANTGDGCPLEVLNIEKDAIPEGVIYTDFGMCLSVLHHVKEPLAVLRKILQGKRVMILEVRTDDRSVWEEEFPRLGYKFELVSVMDADRHFYVLVKEGMERVEGRIET